MTVIKTKKHSGNFIILSKKPLELTDLSWEAKGMWSYLMSRPDNWNPNVAHLVNTFGTTRKKVWKILGELISHGLCERGQERVETGKMGPVFYTVYEEQQFKESLPHSQKPHCGEPHNGFRPPNKDREEIKIETKKEEALPPRAKTFSERVEREPHVFISNEDHQKLIEAHGQEKTAWCYKALSEWKLDKPKSKWRKNDYLSILRWCVDAYEEKKNRKTKPSQADEEENRKIAVSLENFITKNGSRFEVRVEALNKHIEFCYRGGNYQPTCIPYHEHGFIDRLESACHKFNIPWRKVA